MRKATTLPRSSKDSGEAKPASKRPHSLPGEAETVPHEHGFRLSKVLAARWALRTNKYDSDSVLDETVRRLTHDLGIVCPS